MKFEEYRSHDGVGLADLLARGEISPVEAMRTAIEAAERVNAACNIIAYARYDEALAEAGRCKPEAGKFGAVPFLLKDSGTASTDLPSSMGSRLFEETTSPADSTIVTRFRQAGFVTFGRTTVPEMCMAPTTEALRNGGPTRNPFDPTRSCGGSSGGAAVAVAAGVVPVAHGGDGGGSIRIPASCCGVFGLKPTRGRMPTGPFRGEGWGGLTADGVLTRSVRDTARALDLVAGMEPGAPYAAPPGGDFEAGLTRPFDRPLRIALWTDPWGLPVERACLDAVGSAAKLCASLGHEVIPVAPPDFDYTGFLGAIIAVMSANITLAARKRLAGEGRDPTPDEMEPALLDGYRRGLSMAAGEYVEAINTFHAVGRMMARMIGGYDLMLTPTLTSAPIKLGTLSTAEPDFSAFRHHVGALTPFLAVINASGQPAASLPLGRDGNLPIGVQAIGQFGREDVVLRLAAQLEGSALWKEAARWPSL
jgi:amidase